MLRARRGTWLGLCVAMGGVLASVPAAWAGSVDFPAFSDPTGLMLNDSATTNVDDHLVLTDAGAQAGSAFTTNRPVAPDKAFKTQFVISQHDSSIPPGDGMAFVVHSGDADSLGEGGGG